MSRIIEERISKERKSLLKMLEMINKNETANLGIVNYSNGKITTPYGVDVAIDRKIVTQVLKKAKYIKEGSFSETEGVPVIKVTGNIDLAEEIPVPSIDPDVKYSYIQKDLAEKLGIRPYDLQALIFYYKMKEAKRYSIDVTTSRSGGQSFKFSEFALDFLQTKLAELKRDSNQIARIKNEYKNRNKQEESSNEKT